MSHEELLGKKIPHSMEAEQAVIGSILIDSRCVPDVIEKISADDFYHRTNKEIFETIYSMFTYGQTIDPITILDQMKVRGVYNDKCEQYMVEVMQMTPTAANVLQYAAIVRDRALLRHLGETADEINKIVLEGSGDADSALEIAERKIYELRKGRVSGGLIPVSTVITGVFDNLSATAAAGNRIPGISTGLPDLDKKILGLNNSELIMIAARPGMGKTSMALNIALYVGMILKKKVAFFSLEMSNDQLVTRLLSRTAMVPSQNLLTGQLTENQWGRIAEGAQQLSGSSILISDNSNITVSEINAACRRIPDIELIVIDYLQLITSAGKNTRSYYNENRTQAVSDMSRMLKVMAKDLNIPVVCLSQLKRASEDRTDKRPILSDLRESGSIEQDADVVIGLYREGYYVKDCEKPNLAEAIILKNRKGATGTVNLNWLPEYTTFASYEGDREEDD